MIKIDKLVNEIGVERKMVFISLQNGCKEISEKIVKILDEMAIPNWCMYDGKGGNTNKGGDNYQKVIRSNIAKTCVFVCLVSEKFVKSNEVADEIGWLLEEMEDCSKPKIVFFPIYVDNTTSAQLADFVKETAKNPKYNLSADYSKEIVSDLSKNAIIHNNLKTDLSNLESVCDQIKEQYVNAIVANAKTRIELIRNSNIFTDLLNICIKQKCESNFVSEDIKNSTEIGGGLEVHVLSNEILQYDINTYSLVVISSNLLGDSYEKEPFYSPKERGSKYFYYLTKEYENNFDILKNHLKSFLKKDRESRMKVAGLIRRDFSFKNRVYGYFVEHFQDKNVDGLLNAFACHQIKEQIEELLYDDDSRSFVTSWENKVFLPETIKSWFNGGTSDDVNFRSEVSSFVNFINKLFDIFQKNSSLVGKEEYEEFNRYKEYLNGLKLLDDWQYSLGKLKISKNKSKQLVRDLLNTNISPMPNKEYPRIESWLQFNYDEEGNVLEISDEIVNEALNNCSCILVNDYSKDNKMIKLCYSFSVFLDNEGITAAWYTTGSRYMGPKGYIAGQGDKSGKGYDDLSTLVTTYNIRSQNDNGYNELLSAFAYLISINANAKKILEEKGSKLKDYISNYLPKVD